MGGSGNTCARVFWSHQNWKAAAWPCHMSEATRRARRPLAILQPYSSTRTPQDNAAQRQTNTQAYECSDFAMSAPMAENNQYEQACTTSTDICCAVSQQIPMLVFNEVGAFSNRASGYLGHVAKVHSTLSRRHRHQTNYFPFFRSKASPVTDRSMLLWGFTSTASTVLVVVAHFFKRCR